MRWNYHLHVQFWHPQHNINRTHQKIDSYSAVYAKQCHLDHVGSNIVHCFEDEELLDLRFIGSSSVAGFA